MRARVKQTTGAIVTAAQEAGVPVLFSANAFGKTKEAEFIGFNIAAAQTIDAKLDAAVRYGD